MNDMINNDDLNTKILNKLLSGDKLEDITEQLKCNELCVNKVLNSDIFATLSTEVLQKRLKTAALRSVTNLSHIAETAKGENARIRANEILLSNALNIQTLQGAEVAASNMTQDQLVRRLNDLQNEAGKRAKPIETDIIDHKDISLDDLMT